MKGSTYLMLQKLVRDEKLTDNDDKVEELAAKENQGVAIVFVLQVVSEGSDQDLKLFVGILNDSFSPALGQKLHEAALHQQPEHARYVEQEGLKDEKNGHPLVIAVVDDLK